MIKCRDCGRVVEPVGGTYFDWRRGRYYETPTEARGMVTCRTCFERQVSGLCDAIHRARPEELDQVYTSGMRHFGRSDEAVAHIAACDAEQAGRRLPEVAFGDRVIILVKTRWVRATVREIVSGGFRAHGRVYRATDYGVTWRF